MNKLLIIDDHEVVRNGLATALLDQERFIIEQAGSVAEAQEKLASFNPIAMIVDLNLPDGSGFEIIRWARSISPSIAIVVLTLNEGDEFIVASRKAGANAFLSKSSTLEQISMTLNNALLSPRSFFGRVTTTDSPEQLTAREFDVLYLMSQGASNNEISDKLFLSLSTSKTHVSSILRKLESKNRTEAIQVARRKGLLL